MGNIYVDPAFDETADWPRTTGLAEEYTWWSEESKVSGAN